MHPGETERLLVAIHTARGMSAARPFVTAFASVTDVASFARLSRLVRVRV